MKNNLFNSKTLDNQKILQDITDYYHETLKNDPKVLNLITDKLNLGKEELKAFKIGYSNNSLYSIVPSDLKKHLRQMNLTIKNKQDLFNSCITFPVINPDNIIENIIGIKIQNNSIRSEFISLNHSIDLKPVNNLNDLIQVVKNKRLKNIQDIQKDMLTFQLNKRTYIVRGLNPNVINKLKVNIKITQDDLFHIDTVDLYSSKLRSGLLNQCCIIFDEDRDVISDEINQLTRKLEEIRIQLRQKKDQSHKVEITITPAEKKKIMKILRYENLLKMINDDLGKTGIAGEEINRSMLYMVFTSRKLLKPLSIIVKGDSSGGKSYLIGQALKLFPDEDVKNFTEISAKSLFYMPENSLANKILVIFERHGSEASDYSIRSLQSENQLQIAVTIRDPLTNELKTTERTVKGPVSFVESTTKLSIHPENETRSFDLYIDESEEQTKKIFNTQNLIYLPDNGMLNDETKEIIWKHKTMQRLLKPVKVIIDYVDQIKFPTSQLRLRRDRLKFLSLIECFAFLYQYQRERKMINNQEYILADIKDYEMAYNLAEKIMADTLSVIHQKSRELLNYIKVILKRKGKNSFTVSDLENETNWNSLKVRRYLKQLMNEEYIERAISGQGKRAVYSVCTNKNMASKVLSGILTPEELKKKLA